jgi:hypothetical protein
MTISRRLVVASVLLAAAGGLALPALVRPGSEPTLSGPVELRTVTGATEPVSGRLPDVPLDPVPVVPLAERRDDPARATVDDDDGPDDADEDDGASGGGDDITRGGGRTGDDTDGGTDDDRADATDDGGDSDD